MKNESFIELQRIKSWNYIIAIFFLVIFGLGVFQKIESMKFGGFFVAFNTMMTYVSIRRVLEIEQDKKYHASLFEWFFMLVLVLLSILQLIDSYSR